MMTNKCTVGTTGIQACGDRASTLRETVRQALPQDPVTGRKQEVHDVSDVAGKPKPATSVVGSSL